MKIVQITSTATSTVPILYGLDDEGLVYRFNFQSNKWDSLAEPPKETRTGEFVPVEG